MTIIFARVASTWRICRAVYRLQPIISETHWLAGGQRGADGTLADWHAADAEARVGRVLADGLDGLDVDEHRHAIRLLWEGAERATQRRLRG